MEGRLGLSLNPVETAAQIFDQYVPDIAIVREWRGEGIPVPCPGPYLEINGCLYGESTIGKLNMDGMTLVARGLSKGEIAIEEIPTAIRALNLR